MAHSGPLRNSSMSHTMPGHNYSVVLLPGLHALPCHGATGLMAEFAGKKYHSHHGITANDLIEVKEREKEG